MSTAREKYELVRSTIQEEDNVLTTQELCEIVGVSRSGYYNWGARRNSNAEIEK